jgi:hypothetical protein
MTGQQTSTTQAVFVPELWSNEVKSSFESKLVFADLVKNIDFTGRAGDTMHIPSPTRGASSSFSEGSSVTLQNNTEGEIQVVVDQHYEYTRLMTDRADIQGLETQKQFYVDDAGYQLSKTIDSSLSALGKSVGDGDGSDWTHSASWYCDASSGLTAFAADTVASADAFTDACFRQIIQKQDDVDVPFADRAFVIPPSLKNEIMGIDRYVSSDFVAGQGVQNGKIGELYGIPIFVSSNCPLVEAAADNSAGGDVKAATLLHKDSYILAMQSAIRTQQQYKQEYLSNMMTSDVLYGVKVYRADSVQVLNVNG